MKQTYRQLLEQVAKQEVSVESALKRLQSLPYERFKDTNQDNGVTYDTHRRLRKGIPEAIFGLGKTPSQILRLVGEIHAKNEPFLITKTNRSVYHRLTEKDIPVRFRAKAGVIHSKDFRAFFVDDKALSSEILVVTGGAADEKIAEETAICSELYGLKVKRLYDVGVAGLHRLLPHVKRLQAARVIIVVAGMEGALPSVIAGLTGSVVIGVPTSVGYGTHLEGLTPLLSMLTSCADGLAVVNIDNGYGASVLARHVILGA